MNPCAECEYRSGCGYTGEEELCPYRKKLSHKLHGGERDDKAFETVKEMIKAEPARLARVVQMRLI